MNLLNWLENWFNGKTDMEVFWGGTRAIVIVIALMAAAVALMYLKAKEFGRQKVRFAARGFQTSRGYQRYRVDIYFRGGEDSWIMSEEKYERLLRDAVEDTSPENAANGITTGEVMRYVREFRSVWLSPDLSKREYSESGFSLRKDMWRCLKGFFIMVAIVEPFWICIAFQL